MSSVRFSLVALFVLCVNLPSNAALVSIVSGPGLEGLGSFTGSLDYTFTNATTGQLVVTLNNTSPPANGGYLVAFAFNNPGGITGATVATATNLTNVLGGPSFSNSIMVSPFDNFDIGASVTTSWLGAGSPTGGIPVGGAGTFTFSFAGAGLDGLTTDSFVNATTDDQFFLVRFRGFEDDGSDKVPGQVVPEASGMLLLGLGVAGLSFLARRRRVR